MTKRDLQCSRGGLADRRPGKHTSPVSRIIGARLWKRSLEHGAGRPARSLSVAQRIEITSLGPDRQTRFAFPLVSPLTRSAVFAAPVWLSQLFSFRNLSTDLSGLGRIPPITTRRSYWESARVTQENPDPAGPAGRQEEFGGFIMTTILLVEDNEMNRDVISRRLQMKGYHVLQAPDGQSGLNNGCRFRPRPYPDGYAFA